MLDVPSYLAVETEHSTGKKTEVSPSRTRLRPTSRRPRELGRWRTMAAELQQVWLWHLLLSATRRFNSTTLVRHIDRTVMNCTIMTICQLRLFSASCVGHTSISDT